MAGVAISGANAMRRGPDETVVKDQKKISTNAQKQRPESSVVFRACPPLAPSARGGSERLAPAKSKTVTTPAQKSTGFENKGPPAPKLIDAIMRNGSLPIGPFLPLEGAVPKGAHSR
jgi:hypothetical protein